MIPALALAALLGTADPAQSTPSAPPTPRGARLFETVELAAQAGLWTPTGGLADIVDPAPLFGARLTSSYYGSWRAFGDLSGAHLAGPARAPSLLFAAGTAGLEWRAATAWIPSPGLGLTLNYVRMLEAGGAGETPGAETYLFLEDGESEFGMQASLRWGLPLGSKARLEAGGRWELMFTEPRYGQAAALLLGGAWKW